MKPLKSKDIFGNWGTLLLPINGDDTIDWVLLEEEIDTMIAAGVNGIYSNGTAGEFYNYWQKNVIKSQLLFNSVSAI